MKESTIWDDDDDDDEVASVVSDSVRPHSWQPTRLPRPWDSPGKNTGGGCHCLLQCMKVKSESEVAQSCPTHSDSMDCSPPGSSSVHGIFQARGLEWGAIAFSRAIQEANTKRPEFPKGFQGRCSKGRVISLSTVLWLIDSKVIGVLGVNVISPQASASMGALCSWSSCS